LILVMKTSPELHDFFGRADGQPAIMAG
jgi:hypothetical protein